MRVACVQTETSDDVDANMKVVVGLVRDAASKGATLIALPEKFNGIGTPEYLHSIAEAVDGPVLRRLGGLALELKVWILAGSLVIKQPGREKLANLSVLIGPDGRQHARYAKTHMFDVVVEGVTYKESDSEEPGSELVVAPIENAKLGLSVCYDLRFPELYRQLSLLGANILSVPAAFTERTGRDHWEVLLRARAIENQAFVIAPNTIGDHGGGMRSYGRSMIVDAWGTVLATAPDSACSIVADLDFSAQARIREALPVWQHRRDDLYG